MKTCPDCGELKPLDEYPRHRSMADGRGRYCRPCMNERARESNRRRQARNGKTVRELEEQPPGWKRCRDCAEVRPLDEFPRNKDSKDGRHAYCKPCHNLRGQETRQRLYGGSRHYHLVPLRHHCSGRRHHARRADGLCAICRDNPAEHVDRCHETGGVRGILCFNCNGGLGQFRDRVDILLMAIAYLERTTCQQTLDSTGGSRLPTPRREAVLSPTSSEQLRLIF